MALYLPPQPPAIPEDIDPRTRDYLQQFVRWINSYELQRAKYYEDQILNATDAPLRIPDATIDPGSSVYTFSSGLNAFSALGRSQLPFTMNTTSSTYQTALSYTGKGILQAVLAISQVSGGASTAAGMSVRITIDGVVIYDSAILSAKNTGAAVVGQLVVIDPTADLVSIISDPTGLSFNKTVLVEYKSGTNGQGVSIGFRGLKLH